MPSSIPCEANHWAAIVAFLWVSHSILEMWLGKTEKVKAGSLLELVLSATMMVVIIIIRRVYGKSNSTNGSA